MTTFNSHYALLIAIISAWLVSCSSASDANPPAAVSWADAGRRFISEAMASADRVC